MSEAFYRCEHGKVGRSTHAAGTAGAHARYITRDGAASLVMGEHMPTERGEAGRWIDQQEANDRKNARVIDKVLLILPVQLDAAERVEAVREFMEEVGHGRLSWLAGIHDRGEDEHNPHAHILIRDRDFETGKRVAGLSEKDSTERLREAWENAANRVLERHGHEERVDRRSYEERGIDREPGLHIGARALAMEERGIRPQSKPFERVDADGQTRTIDYPSIDNGRTRSERNDEIAFENEQQRTREKEKQREPQLTPQIQTAPELVREPGRVDLVAPDPVAEREAWAARLREMAEREQAVEASKEARREAESVLAMSVAQKQPEAIHAPENEPERQRGILTRLADRVRDWFERDRPAQLEASMPPAVEIERAKEVEREMEPVQRDPVRPMLRGMPWAKDLKPQRQPEPERQPEPQRRIMREILEAGEKRTERDRVERLLGPMTDAERAAWDRLEAERLEKGLERSRAEEMLAAMPPERREAFERQRERDLSRELRSPWDRGYDGPSL